MVEYNAADKGTVPLPAAQIRGMPIGNPMDQLFKNASCLLSVFGEISTSPSVSVGEFSERICYLII